MSAIREEILYYIENISDEKLEALRPILTLLADEAIFIETNLTEDEKLMILRGREEYKKGGFIRLDKLQ